MNLDAAQVVVVGGGVIGSSVAYYLARAGVEVCLVDRGDVAGETSGSGDGYVVLQSKSPGPHLELALESVRLFAGLSDELGYDTRYRRCGSLIVIETEQQLALMRRVAQEQRRMGLKVELLDGAATRAHEPVLAAHIIGSTYSPLDGQVDPMRLVFGFVRAAKRLGARVRTFTEVTGVKVRGGRVRGVTTDRGDIAAAVVVNAAGPFAGTVCRMAGRDMPIRPRRGQVMVTERVPPVLTGVMLCARYIAVKRAPDPAGDMAEEGLRLGLGFGLEQTETGNLLIGNTREFAEFDKRTTLDGVEHVLRRACRIAPLLKEICLIRTFAGLRPYTPDGLPILGPVKGLPGFLMAAGHEGDGVALAPVTGRLIAELVTTGGTSMPLGRFSPDRWDCAAS